ncbi:MAG: 50S ribosomal protein L32 [Candidatus Tectomicrobia bacterium]|nr:50S ribosomal protein L32 [Candidatus Tectomicrobia bacterium]
MALPKRRHSRSRRDKRRTHQKLMSPARSICPNCHEVKLPHRVCPSCGTYNGMKVLAVEEI